MPGEVIRGSLEDLQRIAEMELPKVTTMDELKVYWSTKTIQPNKISLSGIIHH